MDSYGNYPVTYPSGNNVAPDNWWYLGGPDYGQFLQGGGEWSTLSPPSGGKSIMLDITNLLMSQSGGVTQVIPINQTEIKPIKISAYVAAEGCTGNPKINVSFIGYPPGTPRVGGGNLVFDTGTYDFTMKKTTFLPSAPVKYLFFHCLHRNFSVGKAWYGEFNLEELPITPIELPPNSVIINPNFYYSGDEINPTAWDIINSIRVEELSPLGMYSIQVQNLGSLIQRNICIDKGLLKQDITVYFKSNSINTFQLKIKLFDRYRRIISEKTTNIEATNQWNSLDVYILSTNYAEKIDIEIINTNGDYGFIGGILLNAKDFTHNKVANIESNKTPIIIPSVTEDTTLNIALDKEYSINHILLENNSNNNIYITNGLLGELTANKAYDNLTLLQKATMTKSTDTEYILNPWIDSITNIIIDEEILDEYLRIPHVIHPDKWLITTGGNILANQTRYYCVTALTTYGETNRSNEVRAITDAVSNTNKIPIEITPVDGAISYRIYMTQSEVEEQPWAYYSAEVKELIWNDGQNHLVGEITHNELKNQGYIFYDTGEALLSGIPPENNTAKRYIIDNVNNKVIFDINSIPLGIVIAKYSILEEITSIIYVPHLNKYYASTNSGIYESDLYHPNQLTIIKTISNIINITWCNNDLWHLSSNGSIGSIKEQSGNAPNGTIAFCWLDNNKLAGINTTGVINIFDINGIIQEQINTNIISPIGLANYFGNVITYSENKLHLLDINQNIIKQSIDIPFIDLISWNLSGNHLILKNNFITVVYYIYSDKYYAELNDGYYLDNAIQYPSIKRIKLPEEVTPPIYPELLPNGTFTDGTTFPSGFMIYGSKDIIAEFSAEVAILGTKALSFYFPYRSWKSINKYKQTIIGGRQYIFSVYTKATLVGTGKLGIKFKTKDKYKTEEFYDIPFKTEYELQQIIIQAPIDVISVDFRYLAYGDYNQGVTYFFNNLSLKEESASDVTFEHLFNGDFSIVPTGANIPSGWQIDGDGENVAITELVNSIMQEQGNCLKITLPPYEQSGWTVLQSQAFDVSEGDTLEVSFYYKRDNNLTTSIQVSLYHINPDGTWGPAEHIDVSISNPTNTNIIRVVFSPILSGYSKVRLRIWPEFDDNNYIEMCSIVPVVITNKVINPSFTEGLTSWTARGKDMIDAYVTNLGVNVETSLYHSLPNCCKLTVDGVTNTYAEVRQTIYLNQTTPKKITFGAWATGNYQNGYGILEIYIKFVDGTSLWNPFGISQRWSTGIFDWQNLSFDYTPDKIIQYITIITNLGHSAIGSLWVDDISLIEEQIIPTIDDININVPYINLNTDTVKQIKIEAQLMSNSQQVNYKGAVVTFEAEPSIGEFISLPTNTIGKSLAIYTLPQKVCQITLKAKYEILEDSKIINISPIILDIKEPIIEDLPNTITNIPIEIIVPRIKKPLPDVSDKIGRWEVFRSTIYNARQMLDYDIHYSPDTNTTRWDNLKPEYISNIYPQLLFFDYHDDISDYPRQIGWQEIMSQRKEWFCVDATGFSDSHGDGRYYYNWRNIETVQWYVDRILREQEQWNNGIYLDDFKGESYNVFYGDNWTTDKSRLLNFRTIKERIESSANRLWYLQNELNKQGRYLTTNFGCTRKTDSNGNMSNDTLLLAQPFDGFLIEVWLYVWEVEPSFVTESRFDLKYVKDEINFVKWCGEQDKFIACMAHSSSELYEARIFSLASFLMGKHKNAYYCHIDWEERGTYGSYWHSQLQPEMFIKTGQPLEIYQLNNGLFSRRFENCVALLNMNDDVQTYTLPEGTWYTMRNVEYSGVINVNRRQGLVLVKERP